MTEDATEQENAVRAAVESIEDGWCGGSQPLLLYRLYQSSDISSAAKRAQASGPA